MMSSDPVQLDPAAVLEVTRVRAAQQYSQMTDEIARLTVYAQQLERDNVALERQVENLTTELSSRSTQDPT